MEYRLIKCESHFNKEVFKIVLNAPKANVLEAAMLKEISSALTGLEKEQRFETCWSLRAKASIFPSARAFRSIPKKMQG